MTAEAEVVSRMRTAVVGRPVPSWRDGRLGVEAAGEVLLTGPSTRSGATTFDFWLAGR